MPDDQPLSLPSQTPETTVVVAKQTTERTVSTPKSDWHSTEFWSSAYVQIVGTAVLFYGATNGNMDVFWTGIAMVGGPNLVSSFAKNLRKG